MSTGKKDKNRVFVVKLKHDGIFSPYPFSYIHGDEKHLTDFDFECMSYDNLRELARKMVHAPVSSLYYCNVGKTLKQGLCRLENDVDETRYESKWVVDLYVEHHGYDPMDYKNSNAGDYESPDSSDAYCSSDDEQVIDYVDFYHEGEQDVVVKNITTNDPFMTKLCSNNGNFRAHIRHANDWRELLVYCGRDVSTGRCVGYHSKKVKAKKQLFIESHDDANKGTSKDGEGSSRNFDVSPKWTKSKIASSRKSGQPVCGFRLPLEKNLSLMLALGNAKELNRGHYMIFEGGLIEHYARLWEYRQAIMDTNPGSTCILDDEETKYGNTYFRRFYIYFKRVKDGIPCVHSVAAYLFLNKEPNEGVDHEYSQETWFEAYQPRKNRVKAKSENNSQVVVEVLREAEVREVVAEAIGESSGGRGRATGRGGRSSRARGRGGRGQARGGRGRGKGVTAMLVDEEKMNEEEIRKNMEHEYMEQILIEEEEKRIAAEKAIQEEFDEEAVRLTLEEEARYEKEYQDKIREDEESEYNQMCYNHGITPSKSASTREECDTAYVQTQESIVDRGEPGWRLTEDAPTAEQSVSAQPSVAATETTPKGKTIEADATEPPKLKKQGRKRKVAEPSAAEPPFRIYHKNRGRSERIFNQKMKKTGFGPNGEGSTADKAFSL
ncbi:hypothetical protein Tco_0863334 [Tanacetum coccineum]